MSTLTAATIIAETGDPARFPDAAAFASYVGVIPRVHKSGKLRFSTNGAVPPWQFTPQASSRDARSGRRTRQPVARRVFYRPLRDKGKRPKVAMIAAMHKLLGAIYSVAKNRRPFVRRVPAIIGMTEDARLQ